VLRNIFRYLVNKSGLALEMELVRIILYVLFAELTLFRMHKAGQIKRSKERLISLEEFIELMTQATKWMKNPIPKGLLEKIFGEIDTDKDGYITYLEFVIFIKRYFSGSRTESSIDWSFPDLKTEEPIKNTKDEPLYE